MLVLEPLNRYNWEIVLPLEVAEDQRDFLPSNLYSIAQAKFEAADLYAIQLDADTTIGFAMSANWSGLHWITRLMIDYRYQNLGYGKEALRRMVEQLRQKAGAGEIRTSIALKNGLAEYLFYSVGFRRMGQVDDKEIVMRYEG